MLHCLMSFFVKDEPGGHNKFVPRLAAAASVGLGSVGCCFCSLDRSEKATGMVEEGAEGAASHHRTLGCNLGRYRPAIETCK